MGAVRHSTEEPTLLTMFPITCTSVSYFHLLHISFNSQSPEWRISTFWLGIAGFVPPPPPQQITTKSTEACPSAAFCL